MNIERSSKSKFLAGGGTVGTSAEAAGLDFSAAKSVTIKANASNTGNIYVGHDAGVTSANGFQLAKGESVEIAIDSLAKIYVIADAAAQGYSWVVT